MNLIGWGDDMIRFSMLSDKGMRSNNEDSIGMYQKEESYCFILADGLGGHGKGEVASQLAVQAVTEDFVSENSDMDFLDRSFLDAQEAVMDGQNNDRRASDMKTTLVVLHIGETFCRWGHIGDSRLYYFLNSRLVKRTLDHSVPQMLVQIGEIKEKQIRKHPDRNRLLRVLGAETDELNYQLSEVVEKEGRQAFLICSDGFWELIEERKMEKTLKASTGPEQWLSLMKNIVLKNGRNTDMDNYSAIAVWTY